MPGFAWKDLSCRLFQWDLSAALEEHPHLNEIISVEKIRDSSSWSGINGLRFDKDDFDTVLPEEISILPQRASLRTVEVRAVRSIRYV